MKKIFILSSLFIILMGVTVYAKLPDGFVESDQLFLRNRHYILMQENNTNHYLIFVAEDTYYDANKSKLYELGIVNYGINNPTTLSSVYNHPDGQQFWKGICYRYESYDLVNWEYKGYASYTNYWSDYKWIHTNYPVYFWVGDDITHLVCSYLWYETINLTDDYYLKFIFPNEGFKDNAFMFNFKVMYKLPYIVGVTEEDITLSIFGGDESFNYGSDNPIRLNEIKIRTDELGHQYYEGIFDFDRALNVGQNQISVTLNVQKIGFETTSYINVERLEGFIDENGDGLDDRTGRTDANSPATDNQANVFLQMLNRKIGLSKFQNSYNALLNLSTGNVAPPKITIPLGDIFRTATSRFGNVSNPFAGQNPVLVNFEYLQDIKFMNLSILEYFKMIIGFGMIWTTVMYIWNKLGGVMS